MFEIKINNSYKKGRMNLKIQGKIKHRINLTAEI